MNPRKPLTVVVALAAVGVVAACASPAPDEEAIRYDSPPMSGTSFAKCVGPGQFDWAAPFKGADWTSYPAGQRTFAFSGDGNGYDAPAISVNTKDGVEMTVSGVVTYKLDTRCEQLKSFHENVGLKYAAGMKDGHTSDGWNQMTRTYLGSSLQRAMTDATQGLDWQALYSDPATKTAWEKEVKARLPQYVTQAMGGQYLIDFSPTIQKPAIPQNLQAALQAAQEAVQQNKAQQERNKQVASELTSIKALVDVLGPDGYNTYQAIKDGKVQVLPIPQGTSVLVQPKEPSK